MSFCTLSIKTLVEIIISVFHMSYLIYWTIYTYAMYTYVPLNRMMKATNLNRKIKLIFAVL